MNIKNVDRKMKLLVARESKAKSAVLSRMRQIHKQELWKEFGYRSLKQFCEKELGYNEADTRQVLLTLGLVISRDRMKDVDPIVQVRIDRLLAWRRKKAGKLNVAPFIIFSNRTVMEIAKQNPKAVQDMENIVGLGEKRLTRFGKEVLAVLKD
jgi:superfamily II DNA helicase RecQ